MIETKVIELDEGDVQRVVNEMQYMGWHVLSTQKIDYATSYVTGGGMSIQLYTWHADRTSYYTVTFQRDTKMENYNDLDDLFKKYVEAQNEFYSIEQSEPSTKKRQAFLGCGIAFLVFGFMMTIEMSIFLGGIGAVFVPFVFLGVLFLCLFGKEKKRIKLFKEKYQQAIKKRNIKIAKIIAIAKEYID